MEKAYRIIGVQSAQEPAKAIYTIIALHSAESSQRVVLDRRETWQVDDVISLDDFIIAQAKER